MTKLELKEKLLEFKVHGGKWILHVLHSTS